MAKRPSRDAQKKSDDTSAGTSGPCAQCAHLREGRSIARAAYPLLLHALQPGVNSAAQRAADDERYALRDLQQESEDFERTRSGEWRRPPTDRRYSYCGLDEFQQRFYACSVKNAFYQAATRSNDDPACGDFIANGSRRRSCKSCAYNQPPLERAYQVLMQVLSERQQGQRLRSDIDMTLRSQVESEYRQCVDSAGFVDSRPGLLPICEKYSAADGRAVYVIGPIVNAGDSCAHWTEGANATVNGMLARLDALVERARRALAMPPPPSPVGFNFNPGSYSDSIQKQKEMQGNAKGDIIEYCLLELGVDASYAASAAAMFVADVWFGSRPTGSLHAALAEVDGASRQQYAPAASQQSQESPEDQEELEKLRKRITQIQAESREMLARNKAQAQAMAAARSAGQAPSGSAHAQPAQQYFLVQPNLTYSHPANPGVRLAVANNTATVVLPDGSPIQFNLFMFQPGVWTPLASPFGALPVALNVQLPSAVYAAWS